STDLRWIDAIQAFFTDQRLVVYRSTENVGTYRLKNALMENLDCEFIAFHDADDFSDYRRIEKQVSVFLNRSFLGLLGTSYYQIKLDCSVDKVFMPTEPMVEFNKGNLYLALHPTWMMRRNLLLV